MRTTAQHCQSGDRPGYDWDFGFVIDFNFRLCLDERRHLG